MPNSEAGLIGRLVRRHVIHDGASWRIPWGLGRGLRLVVDGAAPLHIYLGTAELELSRHFRRLARPGVRSVEVGSHNAYYSMILARLTGAEVLCVDFDPAALARIRRNLELNPRLADQVTVVEAYVAHEDDPSVGARTLDTLLRETGAAAPGLVQLDVEGSELMVLSGAHELLHARRPHLIIETHSEQLEAGCLQLLASYRYRCTVVSQRRLMRERRGEGHNRWIVAEGHPGSDVPAVTPTGDRN